MTELHAGHAEIRVSHEDDFHVQTFKKSIN